MTAPITTEIPLRLNFNPAALAASAEAAALEAKDARDLKISNEAEATIVAEFLREQMRLKDAVTKMQKEAIGPLDTVEKTIRSWFKPTLAAFAEIERLCKKALGDFRLAQETARRAALQAAQTAAATHDVQALVPALAAASAPIVQPAGVPTRTFWRATVINAGLLPPDWTVTIPNQEKIDAHAKRYSSDQIPDPIPGVKFELEASTSVRR